MKKIALNKSNKKKLSAQKSANVGHGALHPALNSGAKANPDLFAFDSKSLAQLAVGSAVVIATLLSVPDGIALIPNATSIITWTLRLIGNWVIGAVLWFVGFGALVQLLRLVSRGVMAGPEGLKLSRFDRLVAWSDIQAVSLEPNPFFTHIFSLKVPARKLTVLFRFTAKNKILAHLLFPNFIPSFFFTKEVFDALVRTIFDRTGILPAGEHILPAVLDDNYAVFAYRPEQLTTVKNTSSWLNKQRLIVTAVVAVSLTVFLGRKAAVYYCFNSGQKAYAEGRLEKARDDYRLSVKFDPTFAAGWNGLGQTEFHLAEKELTDFNRARKYWVRAWLCKPDYVEPRLGLARLGFYQRRFAEASDNIEHARFFAPENTLAILEHAELTVRLGRPSQGLKEARLLLSESDNTSDEFIFLAHCLIAQAKLDMKDTDGASAELASFSNDASDYSRGENVTYMFVVKSRILSAQKNYAAAEKLAVAAIKRQPRNEEALVQAALSEVDLHDYKQANIDLAAARALAVKDPWICIAEARAAVAQGQIAAAVASYRAALAIPFDNHDAIDLATIYHELLALPPSGDIQSLVEQSQQEALQRNALIFKNR